MGIGQILDSALADPDPGIVVMRRLSHREWRFTIQDLLGIDLDVSRWFPADASGGGGFDNQGRVLYLTSLQMERYYEAADLCLNHVFESEELWEKLVPASHQPGIGYQVSRWWKNLLGSGNSYKSPVNHAEEVLFPFATRAYRRFLSESEKDQLLTFFDKVYGELKGESRRFEKSLLETFKLILVSPHFLYRQENTPSLGHPYRISNFELATRLSYFLWSSMPDEELLNVAYRQDLHDPKVLYPQVDRMLADPKSMRFAESFVTQWLEIDKLEHSHEVDPDAYPEYSPVLQKAMYHETVGFFHHVLTETQDLRELLDSDYSLINETLARHYGMEAIEGEEFQEVCFTDDRRGGLMGMASVLTATSLPTRTSPVLRGKWVMDQLLGTPPPPPPPDVPELEAAKEKVHDELDLRELLSIHRADPACSGCHQKMDPLGLGFENFDAIGRWRQGYGETPIDASGVLTDGTTFEGPSELRNLIKGKSKLFARNFSEKMLSFALGRSLRFEDKLTVDHLTEIILNQDFHPQPLLRAIAYSYPFRHKKTESRIPQ